MYKNIFKPLFDFLVALTILLFVWPILLICALLLYKANNGKVFFTQSRPGKNKRIFQIIKFKTMNDLKDKDGNLLPDSVRLTPIGSFIRKTSIDELPQLFNVLKGDVSLIGPRPLLVQYLPLYSEKQARRHEVKPGISGWAQVNGRNSIDWDTKFELDVWYVDNVTFLLDMKILWMTFFKTIQSEGISSATSATMEPFTGSTKQ